jgi:hypothetical protein
MKPAVTDNALYSFISPFVEKGMVEIKPGHSTAWLEPKRPTSNYKLKVLTGLFA